MKKYLLALISTLLFATAAFAGPYDNQPSSMFFAAPATTPGYPLVQASGSTMAFQGIVNSLDFPVLPTVLAAATPVAGTNTVSMLNTVPTVAVNAGVYLPAPTPGQMVFIRNDGANSINVYPAVVAGTPHAINAIAAGTPAALATVKTLICWAATTTTWQCTWGQGS